MKKAILSALAFSLMAGSLQAQEDRKQETIEGNGKLVTRQVNVSSFDALRASGIYDLRLSQGSSEGVKIEADENLQEYFTVRNEGSKLVIETKGLKNKNIKSKNKMRVYVTFRKLKDMELNTIGNVASEEQLSFDDLDLKNKSIGNVDLKLAVNKFALKNTSVGNVKLSGKADNAIVTNTGVGSLEAGSFIVQTMNIENTGVGSAKVNAEKDLKVKDSFMGKVENKGKATMRKMNKVRV